MGNDDDHPPAINRSVIGRLLEELSWAGRSIRGYRGGGEGYENVLVAETLIALDFLPRTAFLGAVIAAATGAPDARSAVLDEIETADLMMLPPETKLRPTGVTYQDQLVVQPDASVTGARTYTLVEAKRIRPGAFQEEQLAREFVAVTRDAAGRSPLLLLVIPSPPPVPVAKLGRVSIEDAILARLEHVLDQTEGRQATEDLKSRIAATTAWVTWDQIAETVSAARAGFHSHDPSVVGAINRMSAFITDAIHRHGPRSSRPSGTIDPS